MAKSDSYSIDVLLRPDNHEDNKKIKGDNRNSNKAKALAKKLAGIRNVSFMTFMTFYPWKYNTSSIVYILSCNHGAV